MVWTWNLCNNYYWWDLFIRGTAPRVSQEQQFSIQEEIIAPLIHCNHCCNIEFLYGQSIWSFLGVLKGMIPKTKCYLFGIEQFIKQLQKGGKLNGIVLEKITQKYIFTDEVWVPNNVLRFLLRTHYKYFSLIKWTLGKKKSSSLFTFDVHIID